MLETEVTNTASLKLYGRLGFLRTKRLHRYYLNGNTAFRLVRLLDRSADERTLPDTRQAEVVGIAYADTQAQNHSVPISEQGPAAHGR